MAARHTVKLTAHFGRNLEEIEDYLRTAELPGAFDALLEELTDTVIPNLERFPDMGRVFLDRHVGSVEVANGTARLRRQLRSLAGDVEVREYVTAQYLLLYARLEGVVVLLSIRHQRQLSFDFQSLWSDPS